MALKDLLAGFGFLSVVVMVNFCWMPRPKPTEKAGEAW